ncbi:hypothetical protein B0H16DRAFT_1890221 [Mycena metata]|uniref:Uncharacterized protein n=1 Tax=Mycena metata TaxID=1033252 RepID=A0AAD7IIV8_9AGAR|nr:hypothetical protein B0H16DRAFT_1701426 [Mycena metata]KAJ7742556.1 hypothetical protein B0H16DRAFT_1890221 [Mycena metata]
MRTNQVFDPQTLYDDIAPDKSSGHEDSEKLTDSSTSIDSPQNATSPRWQPKLLRVLPIGVFAAFILLMIIGLELFNRYSPYNAPSNAMQFMWTYSPVFLLMVVHWIWTAYDLQVKILVPWAEMSRGPTPAARGWLLDYVGMNPIVALQTAVRYRHIVVLITTLGLWTTGLAGIVATSLFQIEDNVRTSSADFNLATSLNRSLVTDFDPTVLVNKQYLSSYLGRQLLNLSRPVWTTSEDIVLEAFEDSSGSAPAQTLIAQTQGYSASLACTQATASYGGNITIPANPPTQQFPKGYALFLDVDAAGCHVKYPLTDTNHLLLYDDTTPYLGRVYNHTCPGSSVYTTVIVLVHTQNFTITSTSAVECEPSYFQYLVDVSVSPASTGPVDASIISRSVDSSMNDGWRGMVQWLNSTNGGQRGNSVSTSREGDPFSAWGDVAGTRTVSCDCDPWLFLIAHGHNSTFPDLMDTATLLNASAGAFPRVFSSVAQALFLPAAPTTSAPLLGTVQNTTRQLVATPTSIRIAQATLGVLLFALLAVYSLRPRVDLPMDPSSMAAQAFLMKSNHDALSVIIKDSITVTSAETKILLNDWSFSVDNGKELRISAHRNENNPPVVPNFVQAPVWRPMILHPVFKIALCLIVVGTIVGLQYGLRHSQSNRGFADFVPSNQNGWTYAAPAYLFLLGTILSSYTFSVSTLEPFFAMHQSPQPARKSVVYSPLTQTDARLLVYAFRYRSIVGLCCAAIVLTIPFLKIVVSGLITTDGEPAQRSALLAAVTTFNATVGDGTNNSELATEILALSKIETYQLPLPSWTTAVGAIAQLDTASLRQLIQSSTTFSFKEGQLIQLSNTTIKLPLEVMSAELEECTAFDDVLHLVQTNETAEFSGVGVVGFLALPQCGDDSPLSLLLPTLPGWFGRTYVSTSSSSCRPYIFVYGRTQSQNASLIQDITAIQCSYTVSTATHNVTLTYDHDTVNILSVDAGAWNGTAKQNMTFPVDPSPFEVVLGGRTPIVYGGNSSVAFDTVFQIVTLNDTSTPLATFLDSAKLTTAVQATFAAYGAIYASLQQRLEIPEASQQSMEVVVNYQQTRIVQAETQTRILQALLSCVLVFGLVTAFAVRKTNNVLTKPPYSIGATMGLLADSAFVELKQLQNVKDEAELGRVLDAYQFQIGWGHNPKGGMRFGVDIVTK